MSESTDTTTYAETPSWDEFWAYCQQIGFTSEAYAKDKFLAAAQENWAKQRHWRSYAMRVKTWWEADGRPSGDSPTATGVVSPYVLEQMRKRKKEELSDMEDDAENSDTDRLDPAKKARRRTLRAHINKIDELLDKAAGL